MAARARRDSALARAALLVAVFGCSSSSGGSSDAAEPPGPDAAIVALVSPNGDPTYVCTAEAIGPRTILSAAHCFVGGNYDKTGWTFEVFVGADVHAAGAGDKRIAVTEFHLHPDYQSGVARADGGDGDIAVALVADDLGVPVRAWSSAPIPADLAGKPGRYAGYGNANAGDKGVRHFEDAHIDKIAAPVIVMSSARNPCHGDSGGPLLVTIGGVETIVGVGHVAYSDATGKECTAGADYTRTDVYAPFVRSFAP